jgi:hypothetical protein
MKYRPLVSVMQFMKATSVWLVLMFFLSAQAHGQRITRISKYSIGIDLDAGQSFPNYSMEQSRWKGSFYPAGALTVSVRNRINAHWQSDLGIGMTGYALFNKGPYDSYVLDLASPHVVSGMQYIKSGANGVENYVRFASGMQLGYKGRFTEKFQNYEVKVEGNDPLYFFIRPEIGIRDQFRKKLNGIQMGYELGAFFRKNMNPLGSAEFSDQEGSVVAQPEGDIFGMYFHVLFAVGGKKVKIRAKETLTKDPKPEDGKGSIRTIREL